MAKVNTTLAAAVLATDEVITVASATSFAAGRIVQIGAEQMQVTKAYVTGSVSVPVKRGYYGTAPDAFANTTPLTHMDASDMVATTPQQVNTLPQLMTMSYDTYVAAGAISFGVARWTFAQILGTSAIAMTIASPTIDQDGYLITIIGSAKSASTVTVNTGTAGIGNAGASYDLLTFQNAGQLGQTFVASNGFWTLISCPISGTLTNISMAVS
jgi:hypothetical protein